MHDHWQSSPLLIRNFRKNRRYYLQKLYGIHVQSLLLMRFVQVNQSLIHRKVFSNQWFLNHKYQNFS